MLEDVYQLSNYYPDRTHDAATDQYIRHHLNSMSRCLENSLYSSAYSHLHLLYMTYIYIQLLRISTNMKDEFRFCWIGFPSEEHQFLDQPKSPFSFSRVNERTVFRFFRLIGFDDPTIGDIAKPVNIRNNRLHAKGDLFCDTEQEFERELSAYISRVKKIERKQFAYLDNIYSEIVESFREPETKEFDYTPTHDDIETNFIEQYLLSNRQLLDLAGNKTDPFSDFIRTYY